MCKRTSPYIVMHFFFIIFVTGIIIRFMRQNKYIPHESTGAARDLKLFDMDIYAGRIKRIILESQTKALQKGFDSETCDNNDAETPTISKLPCQGLRSLEKMPTSNNSSLTLNTVNTFHSDIEFGGSWRPYCCTAQHRVAIVIPYRNRYSQLIKLLPRLISVLKLQNVAFKIYVAEQAGTTTFNKGMIMNAAYKEAHKEAYWPCFVFHDVDLIPENPNNKYTCSSQPRHTAPCVDEFGYRFAKTNDDPDMAGGVFAVRTDHFREINGYSNSFWGWGHEDVDIAWRVWTNGLRIVRPPYHIARYQMIKHTKEKHNPYRYILNNKNRLLYKDDGLNNLNYTLIRTEETSLYTKFIIDVGLPDEHSLTFGN